MSRRMSCSMTVEAVRNRSKIVTRRHINTWQTLKPGDMLTLIEKGMGLPKGSRQVVLAEVEIVDVRVEPLGKIYLEPYGALDEGFPRMTAGEFVRFWAEGHGYSKRLGAGLCADIPVRRIEWRYVDSAS